MSNPICRCARALLRPPPDETCDLLNLPRTAYADLPEGKYKTEQDLAEKYKSLVSEILRLSLGGIAVFSFLEKGLRESYIAATFASAGVRFFSASIALSLWFLYDASEGVRWYIVGLRDFKTNGIDDKDPRGMLEKRRGIVSRCHNAKRGAAICLALGALCMVIATASSMWFSSRGYVSLT
jgi:hypothetical protein